MKLSQPLQSACCLSTILAAMLIAASVPASAQSTCQLNSPSGRIQHVIYVQFDNTHFRRDNASVPSDLEQMPHLLNFIKRNGTLLANDHTVLISHTATGILTSLTGVYPDRMGQPVSTATSTSRPPAPFAPESRSPTGPPPSLIRHLAPPISPPR